MAEIFIQRGFKIVSGGSDNHLFLLDMIEQGIESTFECGPGKVLSGLNKKIHRPLNVVAINEPTGLEKALGA